ncbi:MAG: hypothetical protein LBR55_02970, partial [Bacteroidales bacterium]|nr:hypothetical protein [Bacteroidales bacterium]
MISSITVERLRRAGEKIHKEIEEKNAKFGIFEAGEHNLLDVGFKVFDTVDAPKLAIEEDGQIVLQNT